MLVGADDQRNTRPRGSWRATCGRLSRLSTRGNAGSGTTYSPGVLVPATAPADWIRPSRMPPPTAPESAAVLSLAAGLAASLAAGLAAGLAGSLPAVFTFSFAPVFAAAAFNVVSAF